MCIIAKCLLCVEKIYYSANRSFFLVFGKSRIICAKQCFSISFYSKVIVSYDYDLWCIHSIDGTYVAFCSAHYANVNHVKRVNSMVLCQWHLYFWHFFYAVTAIHFLTLKLFFYHFLFETAECEIGEICVTPQIVV